MLELGIRQSTRAGALGLLLATAPAAHAADARDFYLQASAGVRWESEKLLQWGFAGGYCPWDGLGLGGFFEMSQQGLRTQLGGEFRWFFEPFEIDGRLGLLEKTEASNGASNTRFLAAVGLNYLVAISSSLAAKAEIRYHGYIGDKSALYSGLGGRLLF